MAIRKIKYMSVVIFTVMQIVVSQEKQFNSIYLDSLLQAGQFDAFAETWKGFSKEQDTSRISQEDVEGYEMLFERLRQLSAADTGHMRDLCGDFEKSQIILRANERGEKADLESRNFLEAKKDKHYREALRHFYAVIYFGGKYIRQGKERLRNNYRAAERAFLEGKYDDALGFIESFQNEETSDHVFAGVRDSLAFLYSELHRKLKTKKEESDFNSDEYVVTKRLTISAGVDQTIFRTLEDPRLIFHHRSFSDLDINFGYYPEAVQYIPRIQIEYFVSSRFSLGARASMGAIYNRAVNILGENVDISEKFYSFGVVGKYYLGRLLIASPYVSLEAGSINVKRNRAGLSSVNFWYDEYGSENGSKPAIDETYPQYTAAIGAEMNFGRNGLLYAGIHIFVSRNYGDTRIIQKTNEGVGIRVGFNLL